MATSWGRNVPAKADSARPLYGTRAVRRATARRRCCSPATIRALKGLAPLNSYARVRVVIPDLREARPTFAAYADATSIRCSGRISST